MYINYKYYKIININTDIFVNIIKLINIFRLLVSGDEGLWLICFLFRSKYRMIVSDYFASQQYLFCPRGFVCQFEFALLFLKQFRGAYVLGFG